jgi:hypothetical protein
MLGLFSKIGSRSPWDISRKFDAIFSPNELPMNVLTCTRNLKGAQCGAEQRGGSERGQNVAGADACRVASVGECIIPKRSNGTQNPGGSVRVYLVCVEVGPLSQPVR